jgi:hypothetical protein
MASLASGCFLCSSWYDVRDVKGITCICGLSLSLSCLIIVFSSRCAMLRCAELCSVLWLCLCLCLRLCCAVLCCVVLCAVLYCACVVLVFVLCCVVLCCVVLCSLVLLCVSFYFRDILCSYVLSLSCPK